MSKEAIERLNQRIDHLEKLLKLVSRAAAEGHRNMTQPELAILYRYWSRPDTLEKRPEVLNGLSRTRMMSGYRER